MSVDPTPRDNPIVTVAERLRPFVTSFLGPELPVKIRFWDGSSLGPSDPGTSIALKSPNALRRMIYAPAELGLARAYVAGDLEIDGDIFAALSARDALGSPTEEIRIRFGRGARFELARAALRLGVLRGPLAPPQQEARLRGRIHSRARDAAAISHHYDVPESFYRMILGETMTYSCAYFDSPNRSLEDAQRAKYDLIATKLGLRSGMRLLDVGCGWGGMVLHAVEHYGVRAVGITLSESQADVAAKRIPEAGLADVAEVRVQDYRDVADGPFDAISSIGMFEHVGIEKVREYFGGLYELLEPGGRLLNHAISKPRHGKRFDRDSFIARYVFPDGQLQEVGSVVTAMQGVGFEARDVESLREHYALTLRAWVSNLEANWAEASEIAGIERARVWRLYMAGSALGFESGRINVHQVLGVKSEEGLSAMPLTRRDLLGL